MGPSSIVHEAIENPGQAVNSCLCTGLLLVTGSIFLYRAREHLFRVDVYLLLCFREHFQPDRLIPDSLLERFTQSLAVGAGAVSPQQVGRQDLERQKC